MQTKYRLTLPDNAMAEMRVEAKVSEFRRAAKWWSDMGHPEQMGAPYPVRTIMKQLCEVVDKAEEAFVSQAVPEEGDAEDAGG